MAQVNDKDEVEEEDRLKPGEVLDGCYRIETEMGRGGIGVVYKAYDLENHICLAIMMLLDKWAKHRKVVARFLREGRLAIRAQPPYIVLGREVRRRDGKGTPYVVMELFEGKPLLDGLKARVLSAWLANGAGDRELPKRPRASPVIVRATTKTRSATVPTDWRSTEGGIRPCKVTTDGTNRLVDYTGTLEYEDRTKIVFLRKTYVVMMLSGEDHYTVHQRR